MPQYVTTSTPLMSLRLLLLFSRLSLLNLSLPLSLSFCSLLSPSLTGLPDQPAEIRSGVGLFFAAWCQRKIVSVFSTFCVLRGNNNNDAAVTSTSFPIAGALWSGTNKNRDEYWVTRSSIRSFARTAHSFACSGLLPSLAPSAALNRFLTRSLRSLPRLWESVRLDVSK